MRSCLPLLLVVAACRGPAAKEPAAQAAEPQAEAAGRIQRLQAEEGDVLARRDELARAREQVTADRVALDEKRKQVSAAGGDLRSVDDEERALLARERKIVDDERELSRKIQGLLLGYQELTAGAGGRDVGAREAQIAVREKDFARREKELAQREASMAEREREQARREREMCSAPPTIVQAPAAGAAATRYTRKDIEPLLASARRKMADKGLLESDLPPPAAGLEREATAAMSSGDLGRARLAADQLVATVDSVAIDKAFIVGKINRLNAALKNAKLGGEARKEADELFRDATAEIGRASCRERV